MWSPTAAWMSMGEKSSVLFQPTLTGIVMACVKASEAATAREVEKYMLWLEIVEKSLSEMQTPAYKRKGDRA